MENNKELIGKKFNYNGDVVEVTHLDENESMVIVTTDFIGFFPVYISELQVLYTHKDDYFDCIDYLSSWKESLEDKLNKEADLKELHKEQIHYLSKAIQIIKGKL